MLEIKILSDEEFDNLPPSITKGSNIKDSLGFSDPKTGKAYVRFTHHEDLTKYLINHEFEELTTDKHSHEDSNGIRHKSKFMKTVGNFSYNPGGVFSSNNGLGGNLVGGGGSSPSDNLSSEANPFSISINGPTDNVSSSAGSPFAQFTAGDEQLGPAGTPGQSPSGNQGVLDEDLLKRLKGFYEGGNPTFQF